MNKYKTVEEYLNDLDTDKRAQVEALEKIILNTHAELTEHIKWNAPSYVLDGEDRITFNTYNKEGVVKLVLHMGATRKEDKKAGPIMADPTGLVTWNSDIRGMLSFNNLQEITNKEKQVADIIKSWLEIKLT